jgi:glycine cleavage system protein P-like pyridoxal-binding family
MKRELKIRRLDVAERLLDGGVRPPTVCLPLIVDEARAARHPVDRQSI